MQSILSRWYVRDGILIVVSAVMVLLYLQVADSGFPLDDSWIHQVYGRNLAEYGEWAFIPGEPSAASTAPLFTILLAIGYLVDMPYLFWTHFLGYVALALTSILSAHMTKRIAYEKVWTPLVTGIAIILSWHLLWSAVSGMETMLFSMFTLLLMWLAWRELDSIRFLANRNIALRGFVFGVASALAMLTRPEGVMLAGIIGLIMLVIRPQGSWRKVLVWSIGAGLGFALFIAPYLMLNLELTGGLLPATSDAKYAQHYIIIEKTTYVQRLLIMTIPIIAGGQIILFPGMLRYISENVRKIRLETRQLMYLLPLFWTISLIALYAARLPAGYQHGRYVIPVVPSLIFMGVVGTSRLIISTSDDERNFAPGRLASRVVAVSASIAFLYLGLILGPDVYANDVDVINEEMVDVAHWIAENLPPEELLAVHDIGAVGYFASRPIVDIAGLISPDVIPFIDDEEPLWRYLQERGARYLMAFPDQIPGDDVNDPRLCPIYQSEGTTAINLGGSKMVVYALNWEGECPP